MYKYNSGGRSVSKRDTGRSLSVKVIKKEKIEEEEEKKQPGRAGVSI